MSDAPRRPLSVINPLGKALYHYVRELRSVATECGSEVLLDEVDEPSAGNGGRLRWLARCYLAVARARMRGSHQIILAWPAAGFFDVVVMQVLAGRRGIVVFHDPRPLVRAVGYGRGARWAARRCSGVTLLVHSRGAADDMSSLGFPRAITIPHPIAQIERDGSEPVEGHPRPVVVLGQFKPERDLELLAGLPAELGDGVDLRIHGRGWPEIAGWEVDNRFLPEDELSEVMASAAAVLIPYRRFYQSGVAIRAIEVGTPAVGPRGSSMDDLASTEPGLLAQPGDAADWARAIRVAIGMPRSRVHSLRESYRKAAISSWLSILQRPADGDRWADARQRPGEARDEFVSES